MPEVRRSSILPIALAMAAVLTGCDGAATTITTRSPGPGTQEAPREVNLIAKDYAFVPATLDLFPGETILLHVINGGLEIHEAVIGDGPVQDAWESAEAVTVGAPPGPTPVVSVPANVAGVRIVVRSGERVDLRWTVPDTVPDPGAWIVGCHIPGHLAQGMSIPIRWVEPTAS